MSGQSFGLHSLVGEKLQWAMPQVEAHLSGNRPLPVDRSVAAICLVSAGIQALVSDHTHPRCAHARLLDEEHIWRLQQPKTWINRTSTSNNSALTQPHSFNHRVLSKSIMGLIVVPSICVTPAPDNIVSHPETPFYAYNIVSSTVRKLRLDVPPRPDDCSARRHLVQQGQRLGSFRLNCAESAQLSIPRAGINSSRRPFNWSKSTALLGPPAHAGLPMIRSQRGHTRARSLNSLAELNDTLKMNACINNESINIGNLPLVSAGNSLRTESRTMSIDLSILNAKSYTSSYDFASSL
ncbi:hypothetical protein FRC18_011726 [Serendipita sp. 400]|nr:hypothetical protein FRC18_011726 [Serendipita sp. 400]